MRVAHEVSFMLESLLLRPPRKEDKAYFLNQPYSLFHCRVLFRDETSLFHCCVLFRSSTFLKLFGGLLSLSLSPLLFRGSTFLELFGGLLGILFSVAFLWLFCLGRCSGYGIILLYFSTAQRLHGIVSRYFSGHHGVVFLQFSCAFLGLGIVFFYFSGAALDTAYFSFTFLGLSCCMA